MSYELRKKLKFHTYLTAFTLTPFGANSGEKEELCKKPFDHVYAAMLVVLTNGKTFGELLNGSFGDGVAKQVWNLGR